MNRVQKIALAVSLLCRPAIAAPSDGWSEPRSGTATFLKCLLGFGPADCERNTAFVPNQGARLSADGPLEKVMFLGTNADGADIYEVRFRYADSAAVISPPGPDGRIRWYWRRGNPNGMLRSPLTGISAGSVPVSIYVRPESAPGSVYAGASGNGPNRFSRCTPRDCGLATISGADNTGPRMDGYFTDSGSSNFNTPTFHGN